MPAAERALRGSLPGRRVERSRLLPGQAAECLTFLMRRGYLGFGEVGWRGFDRIALLYTIPADALPQSVQVEPALGVFKGERVVRFPKP